MEHFYLNLDGRPDEYSLMQLDRLLKLSGASAEVISSPTLDGTDGFRLEIYYDRSRVMKAGTRNAGRKPIDADVTISVEELESIIREKGARQAAACLGLSRATMYRRLKRAKENGYTLIW